MWKDPTGTNVNVKSGENDDTWWYRTPSFFMTMQGDTPLLVSRTSCVAGNGRFWNNHSTQAMSPRNYNLFVKVKEPLRGTQYNTRDELIRAVGRSILNVDKDGRAYGALRLPNIWQKAINKGRRLYWRYINVVSLWIKPCQKYQTVDINFLSENFFRCTMHLKVSVVNVAESTWKAFY